MKRYGIGYTIFEFEGKTKTPIDMTKARPGNFYNEVAKLEKRMKKLASQNRAFVGTCGVMFLYSFAFRVALSI